MKQTNTVSGRYLIKHFAADGSVKAEYDFPNLITDVGLDYLATPNGSGFYQIRLSTNTTAPTHADTALGGTVITPSGTLGAIPSFQNGITGAPDYERWARFGARFETPGTYSTIGTFFNSSSSVMFSKTLIKDAIGTPTSITILSGEGLEIQYELRVKPALTDQSSTVNIGGTNYTFDVYYASIASTSYMQPGSTLGWFGQLYMWGTQGSVNLTDRTQNPAAMVSGIANGYGSFSPSSITYGAYVPGSYQRTITFTLETYMTTGNGLIKGFECAGGTLWPGALVQVTPALPKSNLQRLSLSFTVTWARV